MCILFRLYHEWSSRAQSSRVQSSRIEGSGLCCTQLDLLLLATAWYHNMCVMGRLLSSNVPPRRVNHITSLPHSLSVSLDHALGTYRIEYRTWAYIGLGRHTHITRTLARFLMMTGTVLVLVLFVLYRCWYWHWHNRAVTTIDVDRLSGHPC
jgi:hypothetical protein